MKYPFEDEEPDEQNTPLGDGLVAIAFFLVLVFYALLIFSLCSP